ncbi:hypothetical protein MD484_g5996, partial [Candolleomyces efflorescens]
MSEILGDLKTPPLSTSTPHPEEAVPAASLLTKPGHRAAGGAYHTPSFRAIREELTPRGMRLRGSHGN